MTTLEQEAALIHRLLSGGQPSKDSEYDKRYTAKLYRSAMNETLNLQMFQKRQGTDDKSVVKMYIATYESIDVAWDTATERSYAVIPEFYQSLTWNKGLRQVSSMNKPLDAMVQKLNPTVSSTLPAGRLQGRVGYYVEGLRIYWDEDVRKKGIVQVLMKMVVAAPDQIDLDDPLPLTPEQAATCRDRVIGWYRNEGLQDKVSDENKDIGTRLLERGEKIG